MSEAKLAVMPDGRPSTESITVGEMEPTACTLIMVLTWLPCSTQRDEGDA